MTCNWLPINLSLHICEPGGVAEGEFCGKPSVQSFDTKVAGVKIRMERCSGHKLPAEFVGGVALRGVRP